AMERAVEALGKGLGSNDVEMRTAAARGSEKLEAPAEMVVHVLASAANDPDPDVAANGISALASLGKPIVPKAIQALENPELRGLAVRVLTELGPKAADAAGPLAETAGSVDDAERAEIFIAIGAIGPEGASATDVLVKGLASE